jgi:hypothetical protein
MELFLLLHLLACRLPNQAWDVLGCKIGRPHRLSGNASIIAVLIVACDTLLPSAPARACMGAALAVNIAVQGLV